MNIASPPCTPPRNNKNDSVKAILLITTTEYSSMIFQHLSITTRAQEDYTLGKVG